MKIGNITFDCADPDRMATFWASAMGYEKASTPSRCARSCLTRGCPTTTSQHGQSPRTPRAGDHACSSRVAEGKVAKNRLHLDLNATPGRPPSDEEVDAEVRRLEALGATRVHEHRGTWGPWPEHHVVMEDPEGNVFCVQ